MNQPTATSAAQASEHPVDRLHHHLRAMTGRDPQERGRVSTNLELLFDLTFAIAFGQAGAGAAHLASEGHFGTALAGFTFAMFATCWAWINFSWFASAFDTDDWLFRVTTMVQMTGVLIMAMGLPEMYSSLSQGHVPNNKVMVLGYVVMRVAMIVNWARVSRSSPKYRATANKFILTLVVAQVGWVLVALFDLSLTQWLVAAVVLYLVEMAGPVLAEVLHESTPWHPEHIAERYSLLAIITLGECLIGTIAALSAQAERGWTWQVAAAVLGGVLLTFGLWWLYYFVPGAAVLERRGLRYGFPWGYLHMLVFASLAAVGAGLHVVANLMGGEAHVSATVAVTMVAVPVGLYVTMLVVLYGLGVGFQRAYLVLLAILLLVLAGAIGLAHAGVPVSLCLLLVAAGPIIAVISDEAGMRVRRERAIAELA